MGKAVAFDFAHHGHALATLYVQFLRSDWSKFDRWAHAENLSSILNLVYFDSWSWQSFVSTCDFFNCLFPLDVQNEIQLLSGVLCYSWLVCLLGFCLSKSEIWFWMAPFVKYCILSEVCMIKTAPHSTVSPQVWCIKSIKGWFTRPQICWQDFVKVKLSNAKNSAWFVFQA